MNGNIASFIENAKHIAVVPSRVAGTNAFAAAVGLYYMLLQKEKFVSFIYSGKAPEGCENLIKQDEITSNVSQRELLVSVDYSQTPATQFSYSTDHDVLYLKVGPVPRDFDRNKISTKLTGFDFDLVLFVGVQEMDDLGQTYRELEKEFNSTTVINIDNTNKNQKFGVINIIDVNADSLSLIIFKKAIEWGLEPDERASKALLHGMTYRTAKAVATQ